MEVNSFTANDRGREKFYTVNTLHIFTFPNKTFRFAFLCREAPNQSVYTLSRDKTFITNHFRKWISHTGNQENSQSGKNTLHILYINSENVNKMNAVKLQWDPFIERQSTEHIPVNANNFLTLLTFNSGINPNPIKHSQQYLILC